MSQPSSKDWSTKPVVIVASGPSLTDVDLHIVRAADTFVLAVNDNWALLKAADAVYAADKMWWRINYERLLKWFKGEMWTCDHEIGGVFPGVNLVPAKMGYGMPESKTFIKTGSTSTCQAIQLAWLWNAKKILLLGFDCMPGPDGKKHWFGDHPPALNEVLPYNRWIEEFDLMAKEFAFCGLKVINCSRRTAITSIPQMPIDEALFNHYGE